MVLPSAVCPRFGLYTLACHELVGFLPALRTATRADSRVPYEECLRRFDGELQRLLVRSDAGEVQAAAEQFASLLRSQAGLLPRGSLTTAQVFGDLATAIVDKASSWDYLADLEGLHQQGQALARRFYAESPWQNTRECLGVDCHVDICFIPPDVDGRTWAESFGYGSAPLAYYRQYTLDGDKEPSNHVALARFSLAHDFALYLAYPFLFLHEYTAHVYATDYENDRFNDGWMLHAAANFLRREWNKGTTGPALDLEQVDAFYERLYRRLGSLARRDCRFARDLESLVGAELPDWFASVTYELAAFEPQAGEKKYWPNQFINALEAEFQVDHRRLLRKIRAATNARELMASLASV